MKKVLIIAYFFPPQQTIGSQRPYRLAKYFPKYGWGPTVLTAKRIENKPEGINIIETEYKDIVESIKSAIGLNPNKGIHEQLGIETSKNFKYLSWKSKLIKLLRDIIQFPDQQRGWYKYAIQSACEFLSKEEVDIIISTSPPATSHLIAGKLKQKYNIPWIADLRDPWTQNSDYNKFGFIRYFEKQLELNTFSCADALVTVTDPWVEDLKMLHKKEKVFCVANGFDEDDFPKMPIKLTDKFTLTYTGQLYNGKRDPSLLFKVVSQLIQENKINKDSVEIRFYVPKENWLIEEIKEFNLERIVTVHGLIPRDEVLIRQRESQLLLLLLWEKENEDGLCPGKLYEYFGAMRPIIAMGGYGGVVKSLLEKTNAGKFSESEEELKQVLLEYYNEFINNRNIVCSSNKYIDNYTYASITEKYSNILNTVVS